MWPSLKYKKRPGDTSRLGVGTRITTDANGAWRFDHVPVSQNDVHISVDHPEFAPLRQRVPRNGFGIQLDEPPTARIELKEGLSITGTVTNEAGQPIEGALVKTKFHNDLRKATTDKQGHYRIAGCEPRMARVVVSVTGMAIDMQTVRVSEDMKPVDFVMKPGGKIRVRVVDENGKGIPKARILFQEWRGQSDYFEFDDVNLVADENGVWEWSEAPLDELQADIWSQDRMYLERQPLKAREEEYVFSPPRALDISGSVIDAKTGKPVENFRVTPGWRNIDNPRYSKGLQWSERDSFDASDGKYTIRRTQGLPTHIIRIEAVGYRVAISRDIEWDEGKIDVNFELLPANDIAGKLVTADGEPAAEAKIALGVAGSQINVNNGALDLGSTYATILSADKQGHFSFPARTEPFQMVVIHPEGYAYLKSSEGPIPERIKLTAWARVGGVFRVGKDPQPNVGLSLYSNPIQSYGKDVPNIFTHHEVTTGKDGRYIFERVFPGDVGIERRIIFMVDEGAQEVTSAVRTHTTLFAGKTTTLDLGGTGRAVVGQLVPPAEFKEKVLWNFATVNARVDLEPPPPAPEPPTDVGNDPKKRQVWWSNWMKSPGGRAWYAAYQSFQDIQRKSTSVTATVTKDGTFRIDDVPPGKYVLSVGFNEHAAGHLRGHEFSVPPVESGRDAKKVDLGVLTLEN